MRSRWFSVLLTAVFALGFEHHIVKAVRQANLFGAGKAGYDPRGLRDSVERSARVRDKDGAFTRFNGTHPPPADRYAGNFPH